MEYRHLGSSGLRVSTVSLGSWLTYGNTVDQASTDLIVGTAVDRGVNLLDTADAYNRGGGERALGKAIAGRRREHLVIASKCFFPMSEDVNDRGLSRKHVTESLHKSLSRLGTDYLDLYQCHRPDPETPVEETAMAMDDLIRQGKVLYWGVSMWPANLIARTVEFCRRQGLHAPVSNQPNYNLFEREIESNVIPTCNDLGVGQIVFSPLAQGVLTGKYRPATEPASDTRAQDQRINQFIGRYLTAECLEQAAALTRLADGRGLTPAALAVAWCLRQQNVSSAIVGATSVAQLEQNLDATDVTLAPDLLQRLDELFPST
ncbi:MAG: aldo/keto reductase family protein [Planctomycetota bacterium]|jgi:voltage-dependent potassium channel beta subunit